MPYKIKSREEFNKYLKNVKVLPSGDEILIDEFNSSSLFELYELFMKLKDNIRISPAMQRKLKKHLQLNFPPEVSYCLNFPLNDSNIQSLEEYIKDIFLAYIENPCASSLSKEEVENLKIIIAKKYPEEFLKLHDEKKYPSEIKLQQSFLNKVVHDVTDEYTRHSENMQNNEDIQTAYYTTSINEFPKVNIAISARQKGPKSTTDNLRKEFTKKLQTTTPSNLEEGISYSDLTNTFNLSKVSDDFYGFTAYITNINDTFHISKSIAETKEGKEFLKYRRQKQENIPILHSLADFLYDSSSFLDFTQEEYLQMKIELLDKLQYMTFQECSEEYDGPLFKPKNENDHGTSFSKLLATSLKDYRSHLKADNFKQNLTYEEHSKYQDELLSLFEEFDSRMDDRLEFAALNIIVPHILKDRNFLNENILRDQLDVKVLSCKPKINGRIGFRAIFAILQLPDNRKMEVQFMSYSRYKGSKIGHFAHSNLDSKHIDISPFFELKDEFKNAKNSETMFKKAISILDTITISEKNRLLSTPIKALTNEQKRLRRDIEFALENIQLKETFKNEYYFQEKQKDGSYKTVKDVKINTIEQMLPMFAEYYSPKLVSVSSPHSRVNKNTAFVNIKTPIDNFREVLLKTDETTCLADILLNKLDEIQKNCPPVSVRLPYTNSVSDIKKRQEEKHNER